MHIGVRMEAELGSGDDRWHSDKSKECSAANSIIKCGAKNLAVSHCTLHSIMPQNPKP
jgi:hypothetical protein